VPTSFHTRNAASCILALALALAPLRAAERPAPATASTPELPAPLVRRQAAGSPTEPVVGLELDAGAYRALAAGDRAIVRGFPLPAGREVDLDLRRIDVLAPGARFVVVDERGEREVAPPPFGAFRGGVVGDPHGSVVLSLFDDRLAGSIRTSGEEFVVGWRPETRGLAAWRRADDPDRPATPFCAGNLARGVAGRAAPAAAGAAPPPASPSAAGSSELLVAHVAIDATHEWYSHFGSLAAAQGYILSLIAQVSAIYELDVDVRLDVPYLRVFTTPADPYTDGASTSVLLGELRGEWNAHQKGVARTVAHLFSTWPSGGAGIAYIDVLCDHAAHPGGSYDYGVSAISANGGAWEKELVAHEFGHNFSSPHTHCYVPEIDRCANENGCWAGPTEPTVGTIMSYCNTTTPEFHGRVQDQIRPAAEAAYPTCISLADGFPASLPAPENLQRTDVVD
jgi:hypothetical protein